MLHNYLLQCSDEKNYPLPCFLFSTSLLNYNTSPQVVSGHEVLEIKCAFDPISVISKKQVSALMALALV